MIRLRSLFGRRPKRSWTATCEIRLGRDRFTARVAGGRLVDTRRGEPHDQPDTIIDSDPGTLSGVLGGQEDLAEAVADGRLVITGDDNAGRRLFEAARI